MSGTLFVYLFFQSNFNPFFNNYSSPLSLSWSFSVIWSFPALFIFRISLSNLLLASFYFFYLWSLASLSIILVISFYFFYISHDSLNLSFYLYVSISYNLYISDTLHLSFYLSTYIFLFRLPIYFLIPCISLSIFILKCFYFFYIFSFYLFYLYISYRLQLSCYTSKSCLLPPDAVCLSGFSVQSFALFICLSSIVRLHVAPPKINPISFVTSFLLCKDTSDGAKCYR